MLTGLDHAIVAVRDLHQAMEQLQHSLGLSISPGGEHPDIGTQNAIANFGTNYLELISVLHPEKAEQSERGRLLLDLLSQRDSAPLGFALTCDDLDRDVSDARSRGALIENPSPGSRLRPDGKRMTWRAAAAPGDPWGHCIPFLIQHDVPMLQRMSWRQPERNPLGIRAIHSVSVATTDMNRSAESYRRLLGEPPASLEELPEMGTCRAIFCAGGLTIELEQPVAPGGRLSELLKRQGEGVFRLGLAVLSLEESVRFLRERGTAVGDPTPRGVASLLEPSQTLGLDIQLLEGP